ncbi:farnesyl cysteine-carboxyl methyltransferase [Ophidiomyces ophidiicola]|nr:farnesyl cysteine-carboxyl methyltransferase [Ophidiomyces ophidiicola]
MEPPTTSPSDANRRSFALDSSRPSASSHTNYQPYRPSTNDASDRPFYGAVDPSYLPGGEKSLSGISIRSFLLGQAAGICTILTFLLYASSKLWRIPFFIASLAVFHFLEYYITARYNTTFATITAFLLSQNGAAYNIAHSSAIVESLLAHLFLPTWYFEWTAAMFGGRKYQVMLGLGLMVVGQVVRSLAMAQAGVSFTHTIQHQRRDEHQLIKNGIYSIFRHPSYFGFFWWGLGTQLVLGNAVCFVGYAVVLWEFFSTRIQSKYGVHISDFGPDPIVFGAFITTTNLIQPEEEQLLIGFFGKEYDDYRSKTWVGIPGIS